MLPRRCSPTSVEEIACSHLTLSLVVIADLIASIRIKLTGSLSALRRRHADSREMLARLRAPWCNYCSAYEGARPRSRRSSDLPYREISRDSGREIPASALFDVSIGKQIINGDVS